MIKCLSRFALKSPTSAHYTAAAALGTTKGDVDKFCAQLRKSFKDFRKKQKPKAPKAAAADPVGDLTGGQTGGAGGGGDGVGKEEVTSPQTPTGDAPEGA